MTASRLLIFILATTLLLGCRDSTDANVHKVAVLVRAADYAGLGQLLSHRDMDLRCRAAKALSWIRTSRASAQHLQLLTVTGCKWKPRAEAAWRLMEENAPNWQQHLLPMLKDKEREMRWNVARILGIRGNAEALGALSKCQLDIDPFVAAWCAWSSCKLENGDGCKKPNMDLRDGKTGP
jgi:HEAT repeat protein